MTKKTIQIFRAGTHVGMDGRSYTFSEADVQAIADAYDPATFCAPAVIGHPKHDDPAYAWASDVRVENGVLVADLDRVDPAFADLVEKGRYAKVSSQFYAPGSKNNPKPGAYYLRHVGFLGAAAPGVQGLEQVQFAEGDDDLVEFSTDAEVVRPMIWLARIVGRMMRRQRDAVIAEKGVEEGDKVFPGWEIDAPQDIVAELQRVLDEPAPGFSEPTPQPGSTITNADIAAAELASREEAVAAREAAAAARDAAFAEGQRTARIEEDDVFLDGLVAEGRLPPGLKLPIAAFCEALGESDAISFAEGQDPQDPRAAFKALLTANLGTVIRFDEIADGEGLAFAEGRSVDDRAAAIEAEMASAAAAGRPISAAEASRRTRAGA